MTDEIKISALPAASSAQLTDEFPIVQSGLTLRETNQQTLTLFNANAQIAESQVTNLTSDLSARLVKTNNLSDVSNATTALSNLGGLGLVGGTLTGAIINYTSSPANSLELIPKSYADAIATGFTPHANCVVSTTANLNATYSNGTSGVGATLTNAGTQAAFTVDGITPSVNARIFVNFQTTAAQNGVYTLTTVGSGSTNWVLTRATDFNTATSGNIATGALFGITSGTLYGGSAWFLSASGPFTVGTTALTFSQLSSAATLTNGNGISIIGNQISAVITSNLKFTAGAIDTIQPITTSSSMTLAGLTLSGLTNNRIVGTNGSHVLGSITLSSYITAATSNVTITDNGSGGVTIGVSGSSGGGYTPGSVLFANSSGDIGQDNSSFFWDDTNYVLYLGNTDGSFIADNLGKLSVISNSYSSVVLNSTYMNTAVTGSFFLARAGRGSSGSPTPIQTSDVLGLFGVQGIISTSAEAPWSHLIGMQFVAAENFSSTASGTYCQISTVPTGSLTPAVCCQFLASGDVVLGLPSRSATTLTGLPQIPLISADPTGAATSVSGYVPLVYNTKYQNLCLYDPVLGEWIAVHFS